MKQTIGRFLVFVCLPMLMSASHALAEGDEHESCNVCGMYIDAYPKTTGTLEYKTGEVVQSCGLACLLRMVEDAGGPDAFTSLQVKDWVLGLPVAAQEATYVISSDVIPDMLPNIIAFKEREEAERFKEENGGEVITFSQALLIISPAAMTMPARIQTAVLPSQGATGVGLGVMTMTMDTVKIGSDSVDTDDFIRRPNQMMGPKEMKTTATMLMANYGLTDNMALGVKASYLEKRMEMYQMGGRRTVTRKNNGLSDVFLSYRYNVFKSNYYNHFISVLAETSLPTGEFESKYMTTPGLQTGTGNFTFGGGVLYTYRLEDFWLHTMASYTHKLENSDDFKFGDQTKIGLALHYTPNYDLMLGVETDTVFYDRNEINDNDVGNSGGNRTQLAGVTSWRFLTALGGNFNLRLVAGIPLYEDLNSADMGMMGDAVQLGGGWFASVSLNFKRRFAPSYH